jgi:hypothetical protein
LDIVEPLHLHIPFQAPIIQPIKHILFNILIISTMRHSIPQAENLGHNFDFTMSFKFVNFYLFLHNFIHSTYIMLISFFLLWQNIKENNLK